MCEYCRLHLVSGLSKPWNLLPSMATGLKFHSFKIVILHALTSYRFAESIDVNVPDPVAHKHIPYVVVLVKMAEEWSKSHGGSLPSSREEKKAFKVALPFF